jgi:hypothetical protein
MKVHFKKGLGGYSGTSDDAVYYYHPRLKQTYVREYVIPDNKANTDRTKSIMANLKLLQPSEAYKTNFRDYLLAYNEHKDYRHKPFLTWTNVYLKMMHAMQKEMPSQVDLKTISRQQIFDNNLPCITIKAAVEFGLLPPMKGYEYWDKEI